MTWSCTPLACGMPGRCCVSADELVAEAPAALAGNAVIILAVSGLTVDNLTASPSAGLRGPNEL
jgi:hypothetical protein